MRSLPSSLSLSAAVLLAAGCAGSPTGADDLLREHGLEGMSAQEVVERLDRTNDDRSSGLTGSVTSDEVVLADERTEVALPVPDDSFYLAVAPWRTTTHECFHHNLATCQGELVGTELEVRISDASGEVLVEDEVTTYENGFVGFWLPKDVTGTIEISDGTRTAVSEFATRADSPTCLTTMRLV